MESIGLPPRCIRRLECMQKYFKAWSRASIVASLESGFVWKQPVFCRKAVRGWTENVGCQLLCFFTTSQRNWLIYFIIRTFRILKMNIMIALCQACTGLSVTFMYISGWKSNQKSQKFCFISRLLKLAWSCHFDARFTFEKAPDMAAKFCQQREWIVVIWNYLALTKITQGCVGQSLLWWYDDFLNLM